MTNNNKIWPFFSSILYEVEFFFLPCQNEFIYQIEMCTFVSNKIYCNRTANILKYMLWCVHRMFFSVLSAQVSILITFRWVSHIFLITRMIRRWTWINVEGTTTIILRLFDANPFQMHVHTSAVVIIITITVLPDTTAVVSRWWT